MSSEVKVTLIKSHIGKPPKQRAVLNGMGLTKVNKTVVLQNTPEIMGMINKVSHLVKVEE
jgi:large subunit ribosomal protein L30